MASPVAAAPALDITEIFQSIQGESTWAGVPMVFVRLAGCPLRCTYCDTSYAFERGERLTLAEVLRRVEAFGCLCVEVSGGEPLAQAACPELLRRLCDAGNTVVLETSGSLDIAPVDPRVYIIMDIKTPGSGEVSRNLWKNLDHLRPDRDEIKFVLTGRPDYEWARTQITERALGGRAKAIHLSPAFGQLDYATLAQWILDDHLSLPVRFHFQWHKEIWPPDARGR